MENFSIDMVSHFGDRLNDLLFDDFDSAQDFADAIEIDVSSIRRYLRKESLPTLGNIIKIADCFSCSINFLLGRDDDAATHTYNKCKPFHLRFRELLNEHHVTRYQISKKTVLSERRLGDWFLGKRIPNLESLLVLAKFFDCSIDELLGRE